MLNLKPFCFGCHHSAGCCGVCPWAFAGRVVDGWAGVQRTVVECPLLFSRLLVLLFGKGVVR